MRWHDLRHFAVSLWIEQGLSIMEVMTFCRPATSIQMTHGTLRPLRSPRLTTSKAMAVVRGSCLAKLLLAWLPSDPLDFCHRRSAGGRVAAATTSA